VAIAVKIALAQIFDPDKTFRWIVKINFRGANSVDSEKFRDLLITGIKKKYFRSETTSPSFPATGQRHGSERKRK
jgi:hypothetical protein